MSQDGFFTWLLQWANPNCSKYDNELCLCAQEFAKKLVHKQVLTNFEIKRVKTGRQWKNIDIWAEINDEFLIIIEDKTDTGEHSNQLETYKKNAEEWCNSENYKLVCIYLKTGSEAQSSLNEIKKKGFSIIDRSELIDFFSQHTIQNDIYSDFVEKINSIELSEKSFETKMIKDWDDNSWKGFYQFLDLRLKVNKWEYVSNPAGGFLGLWWHFLEWKGYFVYLQIEQGNLCLKIGNVDENHSGVRNEWHSIIMSQAKKNNKSEIKKPQRFGSGTWMTVAIVERKNWLGLDDNVIEKEKVIDKLKEYEQFLKNCLQ